MLERRKLNSNKKHELIHIEENQYIDVKSILITPAKLSQTISAFANASGGDIYVGIQEDTHTRQRIFEGFKEIEETNKYIQVLDSLEGLNENYHIDYLEFEEKTFCMQITIFKTNKIVKATDGSIWIRKGAQNLKCEDSEKIRRLEIDKGIFVYENEVIPNSSVEDAMVSVVYDEFAKKVVPNIDKLRWLSTQKLSINNRLNITGALLFMDEPQTVLPKRSSIKIYRYRTTSEGTRDTLADNPLTVDGCVYNQIYEAVNKVKEIIENLKTLSASFNDINYPHVTLHEIITNAVLHRDYSIATDIQIRIYDNRVEVESPGKLAGHITTDNIMEEQFARNPKLVRLINKFPEPPNKDVGEGLNTAFKAMIELRLARPVIRELDNSVLVIIKHEKLASPEEIVMEYLEHHDEITNKIGREITGIESENSMKRVFIKLKDAKMLEMIPERKGSKSAWRKTRQEKENKRENYKQMSLFDEI